MGNNLKKKFIFVSDFDGTLTNKDFYQIIIDEYMGEEGRKLYDAWKRKEYKDIDFLGLIYKSINRNEEDILQDILRIPFDEYAKEFIEWVNEQGGDFAVLSAGTSYYIHRLFKHLGIINVKVFSNEGYYYNNGIHLKLFPDNPFHSDIYGIDKAKVVESFMGEYEKVIFAGDSAPDLKAAMLANIAFAKGKLQSMMKNENHPFIPVENFRQVKEYLIEKGVL